MSDSGLALVLSGGGARGAYEAGVFHYIRTMLPEPLRETTFPIQCGSSAGAINTCFIASCADDTAYQGRRIVELWRELQADDVYRRNTAAFARFLAASAAGVVGNLARPGYFQERHGRRRHFVSLFDTTPFVGYLRKIIRWGNIPRLVSQGILAAVSLAATRMRTGRPELFLQRGGALPAGGEFEVHPVDLRPEHALASAAIPFLFSSVAIGDRYYMDGGVRLSTPLAPAIQLGARRILVIGTHSRSQAEPETRGFPETEYPPSLGENLGKLLNALFLDRIRYDVDQLDRINRLIRASEDVYGEAFLARVNKSLGNQSSYQKIDHLEISPSLPLSSLFAGPRDHGRAGASRLSPMERFLMRLLDIDPALSDDLLSYITFESGYLGRAIDLGFEDARRKHDRLCEFLSPARR